MERTPLWCRAGPQEWPWKVCAVAKGTRRGMAPQAGRGPSLQTSPCLAPPSRRVTIRYQPPCVVSTNGRFWTWPGRSRSPEPLGSHWPFPEPQGRPPGLSYSPGRHRSPCNKGLPPRRCINKGTLSVSRGVRPGGGREGGGCLCRLLSSGRAIRVPAPRGERTEESTTPPPSQQPAPQTPGSPTCNNPRPPRQRPPVKPQPFLPHPEHIKNRFFPQKKFF